MTTIYVQRKDSGWMPCRQSALANNTCQAIGLYENDSLAVFKHLNVVACEETNSALYAVRLAHKNDGAANH